MNSSGKEEKFELDSERSILFCPSETLDKRAQLDQAQTTRSIRGQPMTGER